jgi:sigma-B regulation protein RsbU (phosphoserine phosphatase)
MTVQREPKLRHTLVDDLRRGDFRSTVARDFRELKEYMLNDDRKRQLQQMGQLRRAFYFSWWLLKSLLLKLTPARRLLLAVALLLLFMQDSFVIHTKSFRMVLNFNLLSGAILLFVLMLELKDKLLAKEELEAGRAVQDALLPPRSPEVPGWRLWLYTRSANEVGGDLVDFVRISDSRYAVAVGDVAGKGLRAALMSAKLQATLNALISESTSLRTFVAKLNRIFCRDCLPSLFASLLVVEFRSGSGTVRLVNAGHLPPLLVRGSSLTPLRKGGVALGLTPEADFTEQTLALRKNDLLFIYSDGLTDARNEAGEFFGEQRLLGLLSAFKESSVDQIGEAIITQVHQFMGEARATDDLSIAILKKM